jgi:sugar/nucleoside kinase (ribokinase family)/D-arabinose 5-phosphate isomerase GutQ
MADAQLDVAGCGSMVVDLFYRTPRIIGGEEKILLQHHGAGSRAFEQALVGGLTLNHLGWARILGLKTGIFGKMSDDRHGRFLRAAMDRFGIRHHLTLDGSASSFAAVFVDARGNRAIYMARGATGELTPAEIRTRHGAFIRRAQLVSTEISQLPLKTVIAILQFARAHSIPSVLDVDIPPSDAAAMLGTRAEFERALRLATILKPAKRAAQELMKSTATRHSQKVARATLARYGNRAVIVTEGERGCAIATRDGAFRAPAFRVKQVDATGAGDAFLGGVLAGLRWGLEWPQLARLANAAGAVCVTRLGAFPSGFELRDEILKLYGEPLPIAAAEAEAELANEHSDRGTSGEVAEFFDIALAELATLKDRLDLNAITSAVELIRESGARGGRVHVTGVGKPEHVARYAASLFSSIGTPATFLHATESLHGSLGQVHPHDVVIAISNSGGTVEMCAAAHAIKEHGATLVAVTGGRSSELARIADLVIHAPVAREGGGLGLAPRASILGEVMVLAGLSVALEVARGLTAEEYGRWHRAGALGAAARRLAGNRRKAKAG